MKMSHFFLEIFYVKVYLTIRDKILQIIKVKPNDQNKIYNVL